MLFSKSVQTWFLKAFGDSSRESSHVKDLNVLQPPWLCEVVGQSFYNIGTFLLWQSTFRKLVCFLPQIEDPKKWQHVMWTAWLQGNLFKILLQHPRENKNLINFFCCGHLLQNIFSLKKLLINGWCFALMSNLKWISFHILFVWYSNWKLSSFLPPSSELLWQKSQVSSFHPSFLSSTLGPS